VHWLTRLRKLEGDDKLVPLLKKVENGEMYPYAAANIIEKTLS